MSLKSKRPSEKRAKMSIVGSQNHSLVRATVDAFQLLLSKDIRGKREKASINRSCSD